MAYKIVFNGSLSHHGIKGQQWGVQNGPPYPIGVHHGTYSKSDTVFVSGKVKFDEPLPETMRKELDLVIESGARVVIGDAPGADTRCQDYLSKRGYKNVEVYTTDPVARNNVGNWKEVKIKSNPHTEERVVRAQKDIAMSMRATKAIAISSSDDRPGSATAMNIARMLGAGKDVQFYDYKRNTLGSTSADGEELGRKQRAQCEDIANRVLHQTIIDENSRQIQAQQLSIQQANDMITQQTINASINAANMAASLSISGGMNPFMFGMF